MHQFSDLFAQHVSDRSTLHHQVYLNTVYAAIAISHASYADCLLVR